MKYRSRLALPLLPLVASPWVHAQDDWPNRPVRLVIPFPAGGSTDAQGRLLGQKLSEVWKQPVVIDNKPGAGTVVSTQFVAQSAPDGYTLGIVVSSHAINPTLRPNLPYDTMKDLQPIGLVAVTHRMEALSLLDGAGAGAADSMEAAFASCLQRYGHGLRIASLFWGLWLLPFGWLVLRSGRIPRVLGLLLVLGGVGYVVQVFGGLVPGVAESSWMGYVRMPAALGEIGSCLWLLVFGARAGAANSSAS